MIAKDLRIGNLVLFSDNSTIFTVSGLHEFGMDCFDDIEETYIEYDRFEGIKLTEEWHNKFGVTKNGFNAFKYVIQRNNNIDLQVIFSGDYVMIRQGKGELEDDIVSIWNKDLTKRDMYIHEWQNLYFALTGEELQLN